MNKYLEKVAEKIELEPGVTYDTKGHHMNVSAKHMKEHMDSKDRLSRGIYGSLYGVVGAGLGMGNGVRFVNNRINSHEYKPNLFGRLSSKYGTSRLVNVGATVGGLAGAGLLGGLGYIGGGLGPLDRQRVKENHIIHLERKHDNRINEIEGWN